MACKLSRKSTSRLQPTYKPYTRPSIVYSRIFFGMFLSSLYLYVGMPEFSLLCPIQISVYNALGSASIAKRKYCIINRNIIADTQNCTILVHLGYDLCLADKLICIYPHASKNKFETAVHVHPDCRLVWPQLQ